MGSDGAGSPVRDTTQGSSYTQVVPAVEQATHLLFLLADEPRTPLVLAELCRRAGIHRSKGLALLNTLRRAGLVVRHEVTKTYSLGPGVLHLSRALLDGTNVAEAAGPILARLALETGSTALLGMVWAERVVVLAREEAPVGLGVTIRVGHSYPLSWGAHGKAIVAFLAEAERERVLAEDDVYFYSALRSGREPVDMGALRAELAEVRRQGYSTDLGRLQQGINAVGAPVLAAEGHPVGCVILVGTFPAGRADGLGERVWAAARSVSTVLGGSDRLPAGDAVHAETSRP